MGDSHPVETCCRALARLGLSCRANVPLGAYSTWRIGGPADAFAEPGSVDQLCRALREIRQAGVPFLVIGCGSNLLFADEGFRGVVLRIGRRLAGIEAQDDRLVAEAGALACRIALAACRHGLAGLEHVAGIPGTLGGLVAMNGGSQRRGIGDSLEWVEACDGEGLLRSRTRAECRFAYRDSLFLHDPTLTIVRCSLRLERGRREEIRRSMLALMRERRGKFPRREPNCGSVFKSSPELFALAGPPGRIIEDCGFKGRRVGGAEVSARHANFIVNAGGARAADVLALVRQIRAAVHGRHGLWMEAEARYVRPDGGTIPLHEAC